MFGRILIPLAVLTSSMFEFAATTPRPVETDGMDNEVTSDGDGGEGKEVPDDGQTTLQPTLEQTSRVTRPAPTVTPEPPSSTTPTLPSSLTPSASPSSKSGVTLAPASTKFDLGTVSPAPPPRIPPSEELPEGIPLPCDKQQQASCNQTNFERCVLIRERAPRCVCLAGYARGSNGFSCIAVRPYRGVLNTLNAYSDDLLDRSSATYRNLEFDARKALFEAAMASRLRNTLVDVRILGFTSTPEGMVAIQYEILLPRPYAPPADDVTADFREGILYVVSPDGFGNLRLADTNIIVSKAALRGLTIVEPNPCQDPLLNYCQVNARCNVTSTRGFACGCNPGYLDISPNPIEAPGEECDLICESGPCMNNGQCITDEDGRTVCRCPAWFIGNTCQYDGQIILIVLSCLIGGLALVGIVVCSICLCLLKRQQSYEREEIEDQAFRRREKPYIIPRSWYDTWRQYVHTYYPHLVQTPRSPPDYFYAGQSTPTHYMNYRHMYSPPTNGNSTLPPRGHRNKEWTWDSAY